MSDYKYPLIKGGKAMVAATLGACSWIRTSGNFNRAISYYANKYGVDRDELEANVRARQAAGQKGRKPATKGRTFKWFLVCEVSWSDAAPEKNYCDPQVLKGLSKKTVERRFVDQDWKKSAMNDYGGSYAPVFHHEAIAEFDSEADALNALPNWQEYLTEEDSV